MGACCSAAKDDSPPVVKDVFFFLPDASESGAIDEGHLQELTVTAFEPTTPVFNLRGTLDKKYDGIFTFDWIAVDTNGVAPNDYPIVSVSAPSPGLKLYSRAELPREWPEGKYRVDIRAGGDIIHRAYFTVEAGAYARVPHLAHRSAQKTS